MNTLTKKEAVIGAVFLLFAAAFLTHNPAPPEWARLVVMLVALLGSYKLAYGWVKYLWYAGVATSVVALALSVAELVIQQQG
jgi:hypothetical protein